MVLWSASASRNGGGLGVRSEPLTFNGHHGAQFTVQQLVAPLQVIFLLPATQKKTISPNLLFFLNHFLAPYHEEEHKSGRMAERTKEI